MRLAMAIYRWHTHIQSTCHDHITIHNIHDIDTETSMENYDGNSKCGQALVHTMSTEYKADIFFIYDCNVYC